MSLLKTKLFIPSVQPNYIPRPQLEARLKESGKAKLILLSAPAGYGKTTLIADWLNTNKLTPAWISLDHQDNDPARFFGYLAEALRSVEPGISEEFSYLIKGTHLPPPEALMESLINALVSHTPQADNLSPENRLLVILDDYHKIQNDSIHQAVQYLLDYQPPNLLLVLLTREDPPLALARMRAKGELIELRIKDLRFSEGEISRVFQSLTDLELDPESIKSLASITEGWAACLQLAALSAKGHQDIPHYLKGFSGTNRYVIDYLMDEVMQGLTEEIRTFLLQTSILERFTADLCDAVRNRQDSQQILTTLLQSNLFLIPLDDKWEWFRYHHLFGDFILAELNKTEPDLEQQLHQRACQWYRSQGYLEEAINHALLGKDFLSAAELILESGSKMIASGELGTLLSWMKELPQKLVIDNLDLRCLYLWTLYFTGDTEKTEKLLSEFGETDLK